MPSESLTIQDILRSKIIATGLYDETRAKELVQRISGDENAMLVLIGRLAVEAERGGSGAQQGIRALINSNAIPAALETFHTVAAHELSDESFPLIPPKKDP